MVERAIILCKTSKLTINDFPVKQPNTTSIDEVAESTNLKTNEIKTIRKTLVNCSYRQQAAADMLGITRDALIRKLKKYEIHVVKGEE